MYGSLREFSELGDEFEDLNKGIVSFDDNDTRFIIS